MLPDIKKSTMEILLHLAYTGQMVFRKEDKDDVLSAMECLLFGQQAELKVTKVRVITPEPVPSTSSGKIFFDYTYYSM